MSPGRGDGANIALRDAQLLADLLTLEKSPTAAKTEYERQMMQYGFAAVAASREQPFAPPDPAEIDIPTSRLIAPSATAQGHCCQGLGGYHSYLAPGHSRFGQPA